MDNNSQVLSTRSLHTDLVQFKVLLNGEEMSGEYRVTSLHITRSFNKIASAKMVLSDGDPSLQEFRISSQEEAFAPGAELEVSMGYHNNMKTVFKGIIIKHAIKSTKSHHSSLTIEAKDPAVKLALIRNNRYYTDKTDQEIIEQIVQAAGIGSGAHDIESTQPTHKEMVQYNVVDWDFLVSRAEANSMLVLTDNSKLVVKKPDTNQQAAKEIVYGMDVLEFESEIDASTQLKTVKSHAWNYKDQKVEDAEGSIRFRESGNIRGEKMAQDLGFNEYNLFHSGYLNASELRVWSDAHLMKSRLSKAMGRIKINGTTDLSCGQVLKLSGFSTRFNGNVYITGIKHTYHKAAWETDVQFGMPDQWYSKREDIIEKPAGGLLPGINGLQIGIVTQLENDPDGEGRIKVKLPLVHESEGLWARIASLDAGNERGSFFRPEVNDEVVVGFLNDDPRYPVVLGMLNSSAKPSPLQAQDTNHQKGFVTRSKMKLLFDDEKKLITIETPKGKKVVIDDDSDEIVLSDQNQNKVTLSADGITAESMKTITLKSTGGDIKLEAVNIELKANAQLTAEANASATLKSSGQTVVKGTMVMIN